VVKIHCLWKKLGFPFIVENYDIDVVAQLWMVRLLG